MPTKSSDTPKRRPGRPVSITGRTRQTSVYLDEATIATLTAYGRGSLSAGIRRAKYLVLPLLGKK